VKGSLTEGIGEFDSENSILSSLKQSLAEQQVTYPLFSIHCFQIPFAKLKGMNLEF